MPNMQDTQPVYNPFSINDNLVNNVAPTPEYQNKRELKFDEKGTLIPDSNGKTGGAEMKSVFQCEKGSQLRVVIINPSVVQSINVASLFANPQLPTESFGGAKKFDSKNWLDAVHETSNKLKEVGTNYMQQNNISEMSAYAVVQERTPDGRIRFKGIVQADIGRTNTSLFVSPNPNPDRNIRPASKDQQMGD